MNLIELVYGTKDFDQNAWRHIDRREAIAVRVSGRKAKPAYAFISAYLDYLRKREHGINDRMLLLKMASQSWRIPFLCAVFVHAHLSRMVISTAQRDEDLIVKILRDV